MGLLNMSDDLQQLKTSIREQAHAARNALLDKDERSRLICERLAALPEYTRAHAVMYYVDVRSEVRTRHYLPTALRKEKKSSSLIALMESWSYFSSRIWMNSPSACTRYWSRKPSCEFATINALRPATWIW